MFDQSTARQYIYEPDTEVADVEEPPVISRPRTATGDLEMHVEIPDDGTRLPGRHRAHATGLKTACSTKAKPVPINPRTDQPKNGRVIEHPLAPCRCWTEGEWEEADRLYFERFGVPYAGPRP